MTEKSCHDCRHLRIENGGRNTIFFRCGATGRVMEAVDHRAYWHVTVKPHAWCKAGKAVDNPGGIREKKPVQRLPRAKPSWKEDVLWDALEVAAAYG